MALYYCKKCGRIVDNTHDKKELQCDCCNSITYPVPSKYWLDGLDFIISNEQEKLLIEELVKTSPEFEQDLFDHRDEILAKRFAQFDAKIKHGKEILEAQSKLPKCPSCGSSNVSEIGIISRIASFRLFGLASSKIGKTHKCNICGSMW